MRARLQAATTVTITEWVLEELDERQGLIPGDGVTGNWKLSATLRCFKLQKCDETWSSGKLTWGFFEVLSRFQGISKAIQCWLRSFVSLSSVWFGPGFGVLWKELGLGFGFKETDKFVEGQWAIGVWCWRYEIIDGEEMGLAEIEIIWFDEWIKIERFML